MLKKLYIHNFKSFYHSTFEFGKLNCIIAPNNTGKSNLIEAIEFIDDLLFNLSGEKKSFKTNFHYPNDKSTILKAEFEFSNRVLVYKELIDYVCTIEFVITALDSKVQNIDVDINGKVKYIDILEEDKTADWFNWSQFRSYGLDLNNSLLDYPKQDKLISKKRYTKFNFNYSQNTLRYNLQSTKNIENVIINLLGLNVNSKNELLRPIDFKNIFSRHSIFESHYFHSYLIKESSIETKNIYLNKNGTNLTNFLSSLPKDILEDISTSIIGEVEQIDGIKVEQQAFKELYFMEGKLDVPLKETSDGTIHFIAIMAAILGNKNSISIMIEEPERHMHMKVLSTILNTMRDDDKQIFFTTHSTEMLSELELNEIVFMFRDYDGDTQGQRAKDIPNIKKLMKIYKNDLVEMIQIGILDDLGDE